MATRQDIQEAARSWVGTKFHCQGRVKKTAEHAGGVDCLGLLIGVASELNLCTKHGEAIASLDERNYLHRHDGNYLLQKLRQNLETVNGNDFELGNVLIFHIRNEQQHIGIISLSDGMIKFIHAYAQARKVVESELDQEWQSCIINHYSLL